MKHYLLEWNDFQLALGPATAVMGIVNVTPDSFSDGGRFLQTDAAVAHGLELARAGAHILDIGGESTRPFADPVPEQEELDRVVPVIEKLAPLVKVPISIDTTKAAVARAALDAGASMVNDISALRMDPQIAQVAAAAEVPLILMHMKGTPRTMQVDPRYDDLFGEIITFLSKAMEQATAAGVRRDLLVVDPGIGFGKNLEHNLKLMAEIETFSLGGKYPVLLGASRKSFIEHLLGRPKEKRLAASLAVAAWAAMKKTAIIRVHDVRETRDVIEVINALRERG